MLNNQDIRNYAKQKGVRLYEMARFLNIGTATMTRRLYFELQNNEKEQLYACIDKVAEQHKGT